MEEKFIKLVQPINVHNKKIKNRIAVSAMADFGMTGEDGTINARHIEHYSDLARGGAGLMV